ncbi:hypothetical protein GGE48_005563 [Rhizobium leguminosarum]|nr:hypothetical protein [Rhizobium leguminosarum]
MKVRTAERKGLNLLPVKRLAKWESNFQWYIAKAMKYPCVSDKFIVACTSRKYTGPIHK